MKRDLELIRFLLLAQESEEAPLELGNYSTEAKVYNLALMVDAGLIEGRILKKDDGSPSGVVTVRLTWAGHDFLDSVRDVSVWSRAKEVVLKPGFSWTFSILTEFLKAEAKRRLGDVFGSPGGE